MKSFLVTLTAVVLSVTALANDPPAPTFLWQHSVVGTNWQSMTNFVECHVGSSNNNYVVYFPRDTYLLGTVYSNNLATVMHKNKPISTTLIDSNFLYSLKVTFTTNTFAHTNIIQAK